MPLSGVAAAGKTSGCSVCAPLHVGQRCLPGTGLIQFMGCAERARRLLRSHAESVRVALRGKYGLVLCSAKNVSKLEGSKYTSCDHRMSS